MSIRGNLKEASLPDVIQLLSLGRKTGVLSVSDKKNFGDIFFKDGKIIYCSIVNREERIGNLLVKYSDITKEQLEKALEIQEEMKGMKRLGDILIESGYITQDILVDRIKKQIIDSIFTLLTWKEGFFNFEPDIPPVSETITVELEADDILLEEARKIDEWSIIESELPSEKVILVKTSIKDENTLQEENEKYVYSLVNNRLSVKEIFDKTVLGKYETGKAIYTLLKVGYIYSGEEKQLEVSTDVQAKVTEHHNLGLAFLLTEMFEEALREFRHIIQIDKTNIKAYFYIALIYFRLKEYEKALSSFEELLKLGVANVALFNNIALTFERLNNFERADEFYERALKLEPENAKILSNYGILSFKMNLFSEAEEKLKMALKIDPNLKHASFFLALVYFENGMVSESTNILFSLVKQDNTIWQVYYNIAEIYMISGKSESAESMFKKAVETSNSDPIPYKALVEYYFTEKNFDAAENVLEEIINLGKADFEIFYKMGNLKYRKGIKKDAVEYWERALELQPTNEIVKRTLETVKNG
ncbi:MAG: DUF4388 domain-containing protein [bacterium]